MRWILAFLLLTFASLAAATEPIETREEALAEDAVQYAAQFRCPADEALEAARGTASQRRSHRCDRTRIRRPTGRESRSSTRRNIASWSLLTGSSPVAEPGRRRVCQSFSGPAPGATHAQAVAALRRHLIDFSSELPGARGAGYDQRTGEVVLLVTPRGRVAPRRRRHPRPRRASRRRAGARGHQSSSSNRT